jgi:hypothetical protein
MICEIETIRLGDCGEVGVVPAAKVVTATEVDSVWKMI